VHLHEKLRCNFEGNPDYWWEHRACEQLFFEAARVAHELTIEKNESKKGLRYVVIERFLQRNPGGEENWSREIQSLALDTVGRFIQNFRWPSDEPTSSAPSVGDGER